MTFFTARDLRTETKSIWDSLANGGEVVITNNGRPSALMLSVTKENVEDVVKAIRQARAMMALNSIRQKVAATNAYMTEEEIEAEIAASRKERREREAQCV